MAKEASAECGGDRGGVFDEETAEGVEGFVVGLPFDLWDGRVRKGRLKLLWSGSG